MASPDHCRKALRFVVVLLMTCGAAREAQGQGQETLRFTYSEASGCPDAAQFVREVSARTTRISLREGTPSEIAISIEHGTTYRGELLIQAGATKGRTEREVQGATCEEVVSALALVTALVLQREENESGANRPAREQEATSSGAVRAKSEPTRETAAAPSRETDAPPERVAREDRDGWHGALLVRGAIDYGAAPEPIIGIAPALDLFRYGEGAFAPRLRLSFERAASGPLEVGGARADFTWTYGAFEFCPLRLGTRRLHAQPCARLETGVLEGEGLRIVPARSDTRAWLAVGVAAIGRVRIAGPLHLELEVGGRAPLVRTRYLFQPDTTIYRIPAVAFSAAAGLALQFF